jgi:hypothetical protein
MANIQFSDDIKTAKKFVSIQGATLNFIVGGLNNNIEQFPGVWISGYLFGIDLHNTYRISWKIFEFLQNGTVNIYDVPSNNHNIVTGTVPSKLTIENVIKTKSIIPYNGNYTGTVPRDTIVLVRDKINAQEQELFKIQGSYMESIQSHYQATLMTGLLVAMFGTTVLFYTFRQL